MDYLKNLCQYDKRNPNYDPLNGERKVCCMCDNCFYGRTELAEHILSLETIKEEFTKVVYSRDITTGGIDSEIGFNEIQRLKTLLF